jgi:hypothetical protein
MEEISSRNEELRLRFQEDAGSEAARWVDEVVDEYMSGDDESDVAVSDGISSRGEASSVRGIGNGYFIGAENVRAMRGEMSEALVHIGSTLDEDVRQNLISLFEAVGFAESCYVVGDRIFSVERQVRGPARGFIQIEPSTADSVLRETIRSIQSGNEEYQEIDRGCVNLFGMNLRQLRRAIADDPTTMLNDNRVAMLILRLKLGNMGVLPRGDMGLNDYANMWKNIWNTRRGAGTVERFLSRNEEVSDKLSS